MTNDMKIADELGMTNKEWTEKEGTELVGSLDNGHVVGKYKGVMFECIPDTRDNKFEWCYVPLNR